MSVSCTEASEANDYVEAIMASQQVVNANTPADAELQQSPNPRKRHLSPSDHEETSPKKLRNDGTASGRVLAQARRSLYGETPSSKTARDDTRSESDDIGVVESGDVSNSLMQMLKNIAGDVKNVNKRIEKLESSMIAKQAAMGDRLDQLESRLEKKLSERMAQIIDKRFNTEINRLRKDVEDKLGDFRSEMTRDMDDMSKTFEALQESVANRERRDGEPDISCNVVIRDLPEHNGENVCAKVNNLFKDQLRLSQVKVHSAVRKASSNSKTGIIIATLENVEDKRQVLKAKSLLRNSSLSKVYIHPDQSHAERLISSNMRTLVDAVNRGDRISLRGGRVVRNAGSDHRASHYPGSARDGNPAADRERDGRDGERSQTRGHSEHRSIFGNNRSNQGGARGYGSRNNNTRSNQGGARDHSKWGNGSRRQR